MTQSTLREDYTRSLRQLMQRAGISSFRALRQKAGVSDWPVKQLRRGQLGQLRFSTILKLSSALQLSVLELQAAFPDKDLAKFTPTVEIAPQASSRDRAALNSRTSVPHDSATTTATKQQTVQALQAECQRLRSQLLQQQQQLQQDFQQASLQALESWLLQWPTAAYAAQNNPQLPAVKLLPLVKPVEQLIAQWGIVAIAPIAAEIPYDPTCHQLIEGTAQPGAPVKVRYAGYSQGEKLLYRAKVSPL